MKRGFWNKITARYGSRVSKAQFIPYLHPKHAGDQQCGTANPTGKSKTLIDKLCKYADLKRVRSIKFLAEMYLLVKCINSDVCFYKKIPDKL